MTQLSAIRQSLCEDAKVQMQRIQSKSGLARRGLYLATFLIIALLVIQCTEDSVNENITPRVFSVVLQVLFGITGILCMLCLSLLIYII